MVGITYYCTSWLRYVVEAVSEALLHTRQGWS